MFGELFADVPVAFTNSVVAHATFHRCRTENYPFSDAHLFVFVGQGVAGTWMDDPIEDDALQPVELGHMVFGSRRTALPLRPSRLRRSLYVAAGAGRASAHHRSRIAPARQ